MSPEAPSQSHGKHLRAQVLGRRQAQQRGQAMTDKRDGLMNILKGNQAELRVAAWLSQRCYVRPVSGGTDTGIDLYCENLDLDLAEPFLHFWVQVTNRSIIYLTFPGSADI